jgi:phospholipid N-methyltransferase
LLKTLAELNHHFIELFVAVPILFAHYQSPSVQLDNNRACSYPRVVSCLPWFDIIPEKMRIMIVDLVRSVVMKKEVWIAISFALLVTLLDLMDHNLLENLSLIIGVPVFLFMIYYHYQNEKGNWL